MTSSFNKRQIMIVTLLTVLMALSAQCAPGGESDDFSAAKMGNTLASWQAFLEKYPNGQNIDIARQAFDEILYKDAKGSTNDPKKLETLFGQAKTSEYADMIFSLWDEASWNEAKQLDSLEGYRKYKLQFPGGKHIDETKLSIENLAWRSCQEKADRDACDQFLKDYPNGNHNAEAKKFLADFDYQNVQKNDTIEAYEAFLQNNSGYEVADKRLRQLKYEKAVKSGKLEDWTAFYDKYRYSSMSGDENNIEQMKENAKDEIERLLYEKIVSSPTLELCEDYLQRFDNGSHRQQVMVKMEPCLVDHALKENKVDTYLEYLEKYPEGYKVAEIKERLNSLMFTKLADNEDFSYYEKYQKLCPNDKPALMARMEPFMLDWATRVNKTGSYKRYLNDYPEGTNSERVRALLDPQLFGQAQEEDWYSSYEDYIKYCPKGVNVQKAKDRIAWLKNNKATAEIEFPEEVKGPRWEWTTIFKEKSGKIGFKVKGSGYIIDSAGGRWRFYGSNISRSEVKVKAGSSNSDDYWVGSRRLSNDFCNGSAEFVWTGEDAGGHPIELEEKVKLMCPHAI